MLLCEDELEVTVGPRVTGKSANFVLEMITLLLRVSRFLGVLCPWIRGDLPRVCVRVA